MCGRTRKLLLEEGAREEPQVFLLQLYRWVGKPDRCTLLWTESETYGLDVCVETGQLVVKKVA